MSIDIDAIEARENAATPGPWYSDNSDNMDDAGNHYSVMYGDGWYLARVWKDLKQSNCVADAAFIASARQDVPALCAEVRELRAALERARALAEKWKFSESKDIAWCADELAALLAAGGERP